MANPIDTYCAYLRKSRKDIEAEARGEGETLARHQKMLDALAARNGHVISKYYREVVSGESISDRPKMQELLEDVRLNRWTGVYVMEVERLARGDTADQGRVSQVFLYSGTQIITPQKIYDPENEYDTEYFEFSLFMSRREYKTISRRIQAGRMQSVREGKYICSRPAYGYRKVKLKNDKGYSLAVHPEEAEIVRQIFNWYLGGRLLPDGRRVQMGTVRIANLLTDMHVSPGEQGQRWTPCRVYRILTNEVYIGMIRWGFVKTQRELTDTGIAKSLHMRKDYQLYKGLHPALIDRATFYSVQKIMSEDHHTPLQSGKQLSNPLAGLVVCTECGHTLRGKPAAGRQPAQIFCATHGCRSVRTARQPVEDAILSVLRDWLSQYTVTLEEPPATDGGREDHLLHDALTALESEANELSRQKTRIRELLERDVYDIETYSERMTAVDTALRENARAQESVNEQLGAMEPQYCSIADLAPQIRRVLDVYDLAETAQEKNDLLRSVISKVDYRKTVRGHYSGFRGVTCAEPNQFELTVYPRLL